MAELINHYASLWLNWQWAMLWQMAVLVGVVALADRLIRKWAWPQLRHALWLLVLVKLIMPPTLTSPVSLTSQVPGLAQKAIPVQTSAPLPLAREPVVPVVPQVATPKPETTSLMAETASASVVTTEPSTTAVVQNRPAVISTSHLSWAAYVMGAWLIGIAALTIGLVIHLRRLIGEHREEHPDGVPGWFDALAQATTEIGLRCRPRVVFTSKVACPAVFGLFRPVLLMPAERIATMTRLETRHVLLHELAHIKRGDLLTHGIYMVLVTAYWFNPLLWLIRKHLQNLRELCCDATVAKCLREETGAYRETLLATGRALLARPVDPGLGLLGLFEDAGWLTVRLHWLGKQTWRYPWRRRALVALVVALMLCCVLPMASLHAAVNDRTKNDYKVTLSNGATIEVLGIYDHARRQWWRPDGTLLNEGPYDATTDDMVDCLEVAVRYENLPEDSRGGFGIEPGWNPRGGAIPLWYTTAEKAGRPVPNVSWVKVEPKEGAEATALRVHLAMGPWETHAHEIGMRNNMGSSTGGVTFFHPYEQDGQTWCPVAHIVQDCDVRLTAVDINNVEHPSKDPGGGAMYSGSFTFAHLTGQWDVPLDDIAMIRFQTRPYTWIEFRNVAMKPGPARKAEIVTTEPEPRATKERTVDIATLREASPMYLRAFHTGVMRYLHEHNGAPLPKRLWDMEFKMINGMNISSVQFIVSAGYFGPHGYQSLRPEHFTSATSRFTPIMYCTWLLEAEDGRRTNVLFGDGHVESMSAEELSRLKEMGLPGAVHLELKKIDSPDWFATPAMTATVAENEPFEISWRLDETCSSRVAYTAVGVLPEGANMDDHERYTWLMVGLPTSIGKIDYGCEGGPYQPTGTVRLAHLNKPWNWKALAPGAYRVVVLGLDGTALDGTRDWPTLLDKHLIGAVSGRLVVD